MRILVIEDDESSGELLALRLGALHCQVEVVDTAEAGLACAEASPPDAMIVDLKLENSSMSGVELVQRLRATPALAQVPIIVHSVYVAFPSDAPEALPEVEGYLSKPFKLQELRLLIDALRVRHARR